MEEETQFITVKLKDYIHKHEELESKGWKRFFTCPHYAGYRKAEKEIYVDWDVRKKKPV